MTQYPPPSRRPSGSYRQVSSGSYRQVPQTRPSARPSQDAYASARDRQIRREMAALRRRQQRNRRIFAIVVAIVLVLALAGAGVALSGALAPSSVQASDSDATSFDTQSTPVAMKTDSIIMTLGGDADTYVLVGEEYLEAGCHAYDPTEGNLSDVRIEGNVDTATSGDYTVTYTATLSSGDWATAQRTVHVVENFDAFEGAARTLPVLMYHYVYAEDDPPAQLNNNYLLDTKFARQLQYLVDHDYYYPSYQEVRAFAQGKHTLPARSVVLTFDDGERGFLKYGTPLLEQYQVPGTSFLVCSDADTEEKLRTYSNPFVSWQSHSYNMHRDGSSVGKGGIIHALTTDEIASDLKQAQAILGSTEAFAYPYGDNNEQAWAALEQADVLCAFTVENRRIKPGDNPEALPRVRISGDYLQEGFEYLVTPNGGEQ